MKKLIITVTGLFCWFISIGQQEYSFTNYFEVNAFFNPAATGSNGTQDITGIFRKQWVGFNGSPMTGGLLYETSLDDYNMGLGGYIFCDQIGATMMNSVAANYSYQLKLDDAHRLAFGIDAGADIFTTDYDRLIYWDDDQMFDNQQATVVTPRLGTGVHFYTDKYYIGVSVPRLLSFNNDSPISIAAERYPSIVSNYYLTGGYKFPIGEDIEMQLNTLGKYTPKVMPQADINAMATYREMIGLGVGYKTLGFFTTYIQYSYQDVVKIGYAFDITLTPMANYSSGSHELMIKYQIPRKKNKSKSSI